MRLGLKRVCTGAKLAAAILLTEASSALQWDEEGGASHAFNSGRQGEATADVINSVHRVQSAHRADALAKAASVCAATVDEVTCRDGLVRNGSYVLQPREPDIVA